MKTGMKTGMDSLFSDHNFIVGDELVFRPKDGRPYSYRVISRKSRSLYAEAPSGYKRSFMIKKEMILGQKTEVIETFNARVEAPLVRY